MKVYLIRETETDNYKIGRTSKSVADRISQLQTGCSNEIEFVDSFETNDIKLETMLHGYFCTARKKGEWFELSYDKVLLFQSTCKKLQEQLEFLKEHNSFF
jgi:hypothetical protein